MGKIPQDIISKIMLYNSHPVADIVKFKISEWNDNNAETDRLNELIHGTKDVSEIVLQSEDDYYYLPFSFSEYMLSRNWFSIKLKQKLTEVRDNRRSGAW